MMTVFVARFDIPRPPPFVFSTYNNHYHVETSKMTEAARKFTKEEIEEEFDDWSGHC